jgi:glycosyltransferase involved in cell wall biosynthesis
MKIALVVHDFMHGVGHGRYCIELAKRFAHEHEIYVFANRFESNLDFPFQRRRVPAWRATAFTSVLSFVGQAEKALRRENFDVIHAQGFSCRRADVITAHVCNAARYRRVEARGVWKQAFPALVIPRERNFFQRSNGSEIIAVSNVLKRELEEEYGCSRVEVVYHGVDTSDFSPADAQEKAGLRKDLRLPPDKWIWMFAGEASKGLEETIRGLVEFTNAHLVVVSRSSLAVFEKIAADLGMSDRVSFWGATDGIARVYRAADVFVYPSRYDTFAMVVAEAMACGLPVVVGNGIGAAEWIHHGENGFVCDPKEVAEPLRWITNQSNESIEEIGRHARATALQHTWDDCAARTMEVYRRAMASKRKIR